MRLLIKLLLIVVVLAGAAWVYGALSYKPSIEIRLPAKFVGANCKYEISV
jgi:hypothetical protein